MKTSSGVSAACLPAYFEALDAFRSNAIDLVQNHYIEGFMPSFELTYQLAYHQLDSSDGIFGLQGHHNRQRLENEISHLGAQGSGSPRPGQGGQVQ